MTTTKKGYELAKKLPTVTQLTHDEFLEVVVACSKICRLAATLHRIGERQCSEEMSETETKRVDAQEAQCERNVEKHLELISRLTGVTTGAFFNGDPRGPAVKLTLPVPFQHSYDCFGREGICVP